MPDISNIDQLVALLASLVRTYNGSLFTSTHLRDNPNVCHASCEWFLHNAPILGGREAISELDQMDKNTLVIAQQHAGQGPSMTDELRGIVGGGFSALLNPAFAAVQDHHRQPVDGDYQDAGPAAKAIVTTLRMHADKVMVYMAGRGPGHVMCIVRQVGAVLMYDPNLGVIVLPLRDTDELTGILNTIFQWYANNEQLNIFGHLAKQ